MERMDFGNDTYVEPKVVMSDFPASFDDLGKENFWKVCVEHCFPDAILASHYGVPVSRVRKKRKDHNLTQSTIIYERVKSNYREQYDADNERLREKFVGEGNVEWLSKAITHYAFRNGPIEDMHQAKQFSQSDMKTLNKFMVDRIAEILLCYDAEDFLRLSKMLGVPPYAYGADWDAPNPDFSKIDKALAGK